MPARALARFILIHLIEDAFPSSPVSIPIGSSFLNVSRPLFRSSLPRSPVGGWSRDGPATKRAQTDSATCFQGVGQRLDPDENLATRIVDPTHAECGVSGRSRPNKETVDLFSLTATDAMYSGGGTSANSDYIVVSNTYVACTFSSELIG